jgi:hypothetical protein
MKMQSLLEIFYKIKTNKKFNLVDQQAHITINT